MIKRILKVIWLQGEAWAAWLRMSLDNEKRISPLNVDQTAEAFYRKLKDDLDELAKNYDGFGG